MLPTGHSVDQASWERRHRAITRLLWVHVVAVPLYGIWEGQPPGHSLLEGSIVGLLALGASRRGFGTITRSVMATVGLVSASAILTHFSGGLIEMHFHFFVVVAVVALYQSWVPFLVALGFVVAHHGLGGQFLPESVFNHPAAINSSWTWALIHGAFILAESTACLVAWRLNEIALEGERDARLAMERAHSDLATAQSLSNIGSWDWDPTKATVWWSDELYRIVGRDPETFTPTVHAFIDHVIDADRDRVSLLIAHAVETNGSLDYECAITRADGVTRMIQALGSAVVHEDGTIRMLGTCQDITERKSLEAEVEHRAFHDGLTGLANRALFLDRLDHALALSRRTGASLSLLYLDVDDFKTVNDNLGHGVGDGVLVELAQRLRGAVRSSDTIARLGGDEFAFLLEGTTVESAGQVAEKVLGVLREPLIVEGSHLLVRASVGIAVSDGATGAGDLLRHADIAMYAAKRQGKHAYRVFNDGMHSSLVTRMQLEAELAEAIEQEQFVLHYQPLVNMHTRQVEGVEALVRWDHPERGQLPPSEFIPLAEELGLITALGEWVLRRATCDAMVLQDSVGRSLYVSVNVAAPQLHGDFVAVVREALVEAGMLPQQLVLEITETCLMTPDENVVEQLAVLRGDGVRVAIDDFGTGYSSLAYLKQLPIDTLKIDRSFIRQIADGPEESALAHSIIKLAGLFGLGTVGEGIETTEQATILRDLGCQTAQGFLYWRPMDLRALLRAVNDPELAALASALA
jgi:diguanylate cyclase (GGDEF)-like protein